MGVEDAQPPKVELAKEELALNFRKHAHPDLRQSVLAATLSKLSLPEKSEGFDEIRYVWQQAPEAAERMWKWSLERKLSTPVEDLQPGEWFRQQREAWSKDLQAWQVRLKEYRNQ